MIVKDVMTTLVHSVAREATLRTAARAMRINDVGCLPVLRGQSLVGIVTDRDLVTSGMAAGMDPETTRVEEVMTLPVETILECDHLDKAIEQMEAHRIRRLPVMDEEHKFLVGILTLGDVAARAHEPTESGQALEQICGRPVLSL